MSLTVKERPAGYILGDSETNKTIMDSGGQAKVNTLLPSSTGDFIYIKSTIEDYNGFWYVVISLGVVLIKRNATASIQAYVGDADAEIIYLCTQQNWHCAQLPVVYNISNDLYPTNSVDTARSVSGIANNNGYTKLNLSGAITLSKFDTVIISGAATSSVNGVWIVLVDNSTNITVNIPYDAALDFTGASVVRWYNNYNVVVQVWAGTDNFTDKPFHLINTLYLTPNDDNEAIFSINEALKENVFVKNNLLESNLPVNLDAFTQFYIKYAEQYDIQNVTTLGSFTDDSGTFKGFAVQSKLPFKNVHSGSMSDYASANASQKFLTLFTPPTVFSCATCDPYYWDISAILSSSSILSNVFFVQKYYLNNALITTKSDSLGTFDQMAVLRLQLNSTVSLCSYDRVDVYITVNDGDGPVQITETKTVNINCDCSNFTLNLGWLNYTGGFDWWLFTTAKEYQIGIDSTQESKVNIISNWPNSYGEFADTIKYNTKRESNQKILVTSQDLTQDEVQALQYIKTSPLVQIVNSIYDRRTVIVDSDSFKVYKQDDKLNSISFTLTYTDDIPSQQV